MKKFVQRTVAGIFAAAIFVFLVNVSGDLFGFVRANVEETKFAKGTTDYFVGELEEHPSASYDYRIKGTNVNIITRRDDLDGQYVKMHVKYTGISDNFVITSRNFSDYKPAGYKDLGEFSATIVLKEEKYHTLENDDKDEIQVMLKWDALEKWEGKKIDIEVKITEK